MIDFMGKRKRKTKSMNKIFSFDAETNGLWGQAFAIGAIVYYENGKEIEKFIARCPIKEEVDSWVAENVIPQMETIKINCSSYYVMLQEFINFYMKHKADADIIVHMGLPAEARLFIDAHAMGIIDDWDAPYPLIDISAIREINTSVDSYNSVHNLYVPEFDGDTHNPLYDSVVAAVAWVYFQYGGILYKATPTEISIGDIIILKSGFDFVVKEICDNIIFVEGGGWVLKSRVIKVEKP